MSKLTGLLALFYAGDRAAVSDDSTRGARSQVHHLPRPSLQESDPLHPEPADRRLHPDDDVQRRPPGAQPRPSWFRSKHNNFDRRLTQLISGKFTHKVRWYWHQKSIFARITCIFGFSGKYSSAAGRDSQWLSAVARRVDRVSERSLEGLVWSSSLRSVD